MSSSKPLTYDSLKCVLQHLEANRRIELSEHASSIRAAERATPLKIDYLHMEPLSIMINDTEYSLQAVQTCEDEEFLQAFKMPVNSNHYDLDDYGGPDNSNEMLALPGDIVVDMNVQNIHLNQVDMETQLRNMMIEKGLERPTEHIEPRRYEHGINLQIMNHLQQCLLPMRLKEDNVPSPFTKRIELTIRRGGIVKTEILLNESKIHEAMKYLMHKILGGRRAPIYVKEFRAPSQRGVLRVPKGLKLKIEHLGVGHNVQKVVECLNPILDESSFPIKSVELTAYAHLPENFQHPVVLNAKKLNVGQLSFIIPWQNLFQHLPNQEIFWRTASFTNREMIGFIRHWIQNPRTIGKSFACSISSESFAKEIFPLIQELPNANLVNLEVPRSEHFPNCISIPINDSSELNIYGEDDDHGSWTFKMEVMPRGTAKSLDL